MVKSEAKTVEAYLDSLADDRREAIGRVREVILSNLPKGYEESMGWGMISYIIPLTRYPVTYNKKPLVMAALAAQKNGNTLYLMSVYGDRSTEAWFKERFAASGKKLSMGKSCVYFKRADDLPLDLIGEVIGRSSVAQFIERYERARKPES